MQEQEQEQEKEQEQQKEQEREPEAPANQKYSRTVSIDIKTQLETLYRQMRCVFALSHFPVKFF